jgi:anti-anti-sigma factor
MCRVEQVVMAVDLGLIENTHAGHPPIALGRRPWSRIGFRGVGPVLAKGPLQPDGRQRQRSRSLVGKSLGPCEGPASGLSSWQQKCSLDGLVGPCRPNSGGTEKGSVQTPDTQPELPAVTPGGGVGVNRRLDARTEHLTTGVLLVRASGSIDKGTAFGFERQLIETIRRSPVAPVRMMLDLSEVTFLDRPGLNMLLRIQARFESGSGELQLVKPTPSVVRLLHQAHLDGASWMWPSD